ncbi:MAG: LacI family DNA-binding transcriptional regulator [Candidatus Cryptobacteroides sp.]
MKSITIKDVAREAGVSTTLVSRVLNAERTEDGIPVCAVNRETAKRIADTIKAMGYRPNTAASSLRKKRNNRIGVILPDISHHYFASMARHFEDLAQTKGYTVLLGSSGNDAQKIEQLALTFVQDNADGIILVPGIKCEQIVEKIVRERIPLVIAVRNLPGVEGVGKVLTDNIKGTECALDHLTGRGFKKIEMISTTQRFSNVVEREKLYMEYMERKGLEASISHCDYTNSTESITFIIKECRRKGTDALYCPNASLPLLCLKTCKELKIKIPEDFALCGYDGGELYTLTSPSITTVSYSKEEVAGQAFRILTDMMENGSVQAGEAIVEPSLVEGESSRSIPAETKKPNEKDFHSALDSILYCQQALSTLYHKLTTPDSESSPVEN